MQRPDPGGGTTIGDRERESVLIAALPPLIKDGFFVQAQTTTTAQLLRPRPFDAATAIFSALLCGVGLLIYIAMHFARPYEVLYLVVDEYGAIHRLTKWPP